MTSKEALRVMAIVGELINITEELQVEIDKLMKEANSAN